MRFIGLFLVGYGTTSMALSAVSSNSPGLAIAATSLSFIAGYVAASTASPRP